MRLKGIGYMRYRHLLYIHRIQQENTQMYPKKLPTVLKKRRVDKKQGYDKILIS